MVVSVIYSLISPISLNAFKVICIFYLTWNGWLNLTPSTNIPSTLDSVLSPWPLGSSSPPPVELSPPLAPPALSASSRRRSFSSRLQRRSLMANSSPETKHSHLIKRYISDLKRKKNCWSQEHYRQTEGPKVAQWSAKAICIWYKPR